MNKVISVGNVVRDPDVRYTQEGLAIARFTMALQGTKKKDDGNYEADFPSYVAFGKSAEFIEKYITKGSKIGVEGRLKTGSYDDKDGKKVYTTDVVVEKVEFCGKKGDNDTKAEDQADAFMNIPDGLLEELPFN